MIIEFSRYGKTYESAVNAPIGQPPPPMLQIVFRPCVLRPPFQLVLAWQGTDDLRGIELYRPVREVHQP